MSPKQSSWLSARGRNYGLNDYTMNFHIDDAPINQSNQSNSLGLIILSWKAHIHEISKKVSSGIGALKLSRPFVSLHTAIKIYKSLIEPHFDYCSAVWDGFSQQRSEKRQNFKIVLSELSLNLAIILAPHFFLTRLVGTIYRLEGLKKRPACRNMLRRYVALTCCERLAGAICTILVSSAEHRHY